MVALLAADRRVTQSSNGVRPTRSSRDPDNKLDPSTTMSSRRADNVVGPADNLVT
jgi:hypothetical protein